VLEPDHPNTGTGLYSLGLLLRDLGQLEAARPYLERALAICEKVLGPDHPDTATARVAIDATQH
jgi:Tetratricopeptide repeat